MLAKAKAKTAKTLNKVILVDSNISNINEFLALYIVIEIFDVKIVYSFNPQDICIKSLRLLKLLYF